MRPSYGISAGKQLLEPSSRIGNRLEDLVGETVSESGLVCRHDYRIGRSRLLAGVGVAANCSYLEADSFDVPWPHLRRYFQAEGLVWRGSDIITDDQLYRTDFYRHVMRPQHASRSLHAVIAVQGSILDHIVLLRGQSHSDFNDHEIKVCRSYVSDRDLVVVGLLSVLQDRGIGVAVVDAGAEIVASNRLFVEITNRLSIRSAPKARRAVNVEIPNILPDPIIRLMQSGNSSSTHVFQCEGKGGRLLCNMQPIASDLTPLMAQPPVLAIVVRDLDATPQLDEATMRSSFGFTPAEARVSVLVGRGDRLEEAASVLGISANTARTHLKRIFEKTSTHRQAELVKLLLSFSRRNP